MIDTREYHDSKIHVSAGPFGGDLVRADDALCADGVRRNAHPSGNGIADTFFSIPAFVYVHRTRVYGYVTIETMNGFTTHDTDDDPLTVKFRAYTYRKNHALIATKEAS